MSRIRPCSARPGSGPVTLKNRIIKAATFEGAAPRGEVTDQLIDFHRRVADGGCGHDHGGLSGRGTRGSDRSPLRAARGGVARRVCAGSPRRFTKPGRQRRRRSAMPGRWPTRGRTGRPSLAPSRRFSPTGTVTRAASEEDIARITEEYRRGATVAVEAGFDCIEIHLGHNYLLSAFLSPKLNRRTDQWGGSLANRARFPRQVVSAVREAVGDQVAVTAKLNMADGVPGGFWLEESIEFARMLESDGALDALELTGGSSLSNPMYLFRGEAPRARVRRHPAAASAGRVSGRWARGSSRTTPSKRPSSCPMPASSSMPSRCP